MSPSHRPTILAVDDSTVMQALIRNALDAEYRVVVAANAIEALAVLNHEPVAVLLLDIAMPGINGLDLCRTIRSLPQFANLPIVMLTSRDTLMDKVQGRISGATEYLTKPFEPEQLCQVVCQFVGATFLNDAGLNTTPAAHSAPMIPD